MGESFHFVTCDVGFSEKYREKWVKVLVRMGLNCREVRNLGIGMALRLGT